MDTDVATYTINTILQGTTVSNEMNSYWAFVKTGTGSFIKVTVQAPNSYVAGEILKNTYGQNLQTGPALMT